ncbi:MAG: FHA domain-containing protein [bacterium]|nr:FHA domain-containing protein [bacterium]
MPEIIVKLGDNIVQKYFFIKESMSIGRAPENEIVIENLAISRHHATIRHENGRYYLIDEDSSNGTYVNGVRIQKTEIMDRDVVTVGKHKLYYYDQQAEPAKRVTSDDRTMVFEPTTDAQIEVVKGRQKGALFDLTGPTTTIGRGTGNDIRLNDWFISKSHAVIERHGQDFMIRDLGSWRHTIVNGREIDEAYLNDGDEIQLGPTVLIRFAHKSPTPAARMPIRMPVELGADAPAPSAPQPPVAVAISAADLTPTTRFSPEILGNLAPRAANGAVARAEEETGVPNAADAAAEAADDMAAELDQAAEAGPVAEPRENAALSDIERPAEAVGAGPVAEPIDTPEEYAAPSDTDQPSEEEDDSAPKLDAAYEAMDKNEVLFDPMPVLGDAFEAPVEAFTAEETGEAESTEPAGDYASASDVEAVLTGQAEAAAYPIDIVAGGEAVSRDAVREEKGAEAAAIVELAAGAASEPTPLDMALESVDDLETAPGADGADAVAATGAGADGPTGGTQDGQLADEIALWERALANRSPLIRKQAARRLKKLTGKDYEF